MEAVNPCTGLSRNASSRSLNFYPPTIFLKITVFA
jgi:hypothetical protein